MKDYSPKHKKKGSKRRILVPILLVVFFLGFLVGTYKTISIVYEDKHSSTAYTELRSQARGNTNVQSLPSVTALNDKEGTEEKTVVTEIETSEAPSEAAEGSSRQRRQTMDLKSLQETYPEMKGWILAEGTGIDYPIMQASDNEYYLSHLYDGRTNANGSIFMDYRNTGMFTDDNTVIYGHHMQSGAMFRSLVEYKAQDFYDTHPTMMVYTAEGDYLVELICGTIEDGNYEFVKFSFDDFEDMNEYVSELKSRSTFESNITLLPGDKIISLCTCTYERQNARYMLLGRITELYE